MNNCLINIIIIIILLAIFSKSNIKETFACRIEKRCPTKEEILAVAKEERWPKFDAGNTITDCHIDMGDKGPHKHKKEVEVCDDTEQVSQPKQSSSGSLCKSIKISNPGCPDKGYRGWNFLDNANHKCKYNDPLDENLSNVASLCDKEINENDDRIDIKKVINGKQKIEEDKEYVVLLLTSGSKQFLDIKKIKGSEIVNKGKLRNRDKRTYELVNFSELINAMSLELFFEYEKIINGKKYFIGYSDLDRDFGNIQNLVILTENLEVMNMNDSKIKDIFRELCNKCNLIQWKKVGNNFYIEKYISCGIDNFNINKIN